VTIAKRLAPLNAAMLTAQLFTDALVEFGTPRCYVVRRVEVVLGVQVESAPSAPKCVTPVDTFAPAAPKELASVSDDKGVNLVWEANSERDLAGYIVMRGETPGEMMAPLTPEPIHETAFRDTAVQTGHSYVYAVVAVDTATPPNRSAESNRQTEVIR
jgi:fibronectin type 3 domain-containing protein